MRRAKASPSLALPRAAAPSSPTVSGPSLSGFRCKLGDVVMRAGGDEAWLAGALVLSEQRPTSALFIAPDAAGERAIYAKPEPAPSLAWLVPVRADALGLGLAGAPPSTIELGANRFERVRRIPVRVTRLGSGTPDVGDVTTVGEYADAAGCVLLVLTGSGGAWAWTGSRLEDGMFDVLPGRDDEDYCSG